MPDPYFKPQSRETRALGRRFRAAREASQVTLRSLADRMGRSFYIIRRHEAGHTMMRIDDLIKAAKILGVEPCDLLRTKEVSDGAS